MFLDRISAASPETPLITRDAVATQQWEAVVAESEVGKRAQAWNSRRFLSWPGWLAACWETARASAVVDPNRLLLNPNQTEQLWQQVIDASAQGPALISNRGVSRWARTARRSLLDCGLAPDRQGGARWQDDSAAFLDWNRRFEQRLKQNAWVDADSVVSEIARLPASGIGHDLCLLDPPPAAPVTHEIFERWRAAGHRVDAVESRAHEASIHAQIAADPRHELEQAAEWAADALQSAANRRLAVVVPDLDTRLDEVESVFTESLGSDACFVSSKRSLGDIAVFGAALTAIELLAGRAGFSVLSRWLRSPFFGSKDPDRDRHAAALEIALRTEPRAQQDFGDAWQNWGLKTRFRHLPDTAERLGLAFDQLPKRASPTGWTVAWQSCLTKLGWRGFELELGERLQNAWDQAWAGFSELTPIVGQLDRAEAFERFSRIAASQSTYEPMPLDGVHVFKRMTHVGPGYDGAWICGFSDEIRPETSTPNPLVPWPVQVRHDMPGANPDTERAGLQAELTSLTQRVPALLFSCPSRNGDRPLLPNPLLGDWTKTTASRSQAARGRAAAIQRIGVRRWQQSDDVAPPLTGNTIPGGTRTLDLQALCPVKAFCVSRLKAEPLEAPSRGIDPRQRGILIHRVLELWLGPKEQDPNRTDLEHCLETAFAERYPPGDAGWQAQVDAERERIEQLVAQLLEFEAGRPAYATIAAERKAEIVIDGRRISCRIDRIDEIETAGLLLIDYKTGQSGGGRWFESRLSDCQLPVYAQHAPSIAGIATVRLGDSGIEMRSAGLATLGLPGKQAIFEAADWAAQLDRWRAQIGELLEEFSSGDARIRLASVRSLRSDGPEDAGGAFAPLTRIGDFE